MIVGAVERGRAYIFDPNAGYAVAVEAQHMGRALGDIYHAIAVIGPAVIDPQDHRTLVAQVGDADIGR